MNYIWLPIYTENSREAADRWVKGKRDKGSASPQIVYTPRETGIRKALYRMKSGGCLRNITTVDKLYILVHGSRSAVGWTRSDGVTKNYTPEQLVTLMEKEGLTKRIVHVSVFSCDSGLGEKSSFSSRLKQAMNTRGFREVTVTGYLGTISSNYEHRYMTENSSFWTAEKYKGVTVGRWNRMVRASNHKITF